MKERKMEAGSGYEIKGNDKKRELSARTALSRASNSLNRCATIHGCTKTNQASTVELTLGMTGIAFALAGWAGGIRNRRIYTYPHGTFIRPPLTPNNILLTERDQNRRKVL